MDDESAPHHPPHAQQSHHAHPAHHPASAHSAMHMHPREGENNRRYSRARSVLHENTVNFLRFLLRHKWKVLVLFILFVIYLKATQTFTALVIVAILIALASISTIYKYWIKLSFGFELVTFSLVLSTVFYGPLVGFAVGFISAVLAEVLPQMIEPSSFFWTTSVGASAFLVAAIFWAFHPPLIVLAMASFALQMAISEPIRLMGPPEIKLQGILYITTGFVWNIFVFTRIAPFVHPFLAQFVR